MNITLLTTLVTLFVSISSAAEIVTTGGKCAHEKLFLAHQLAENNKLPTEIGTLIIKVIDSMGWRVVSFPPDYVIGIKFEANAIFAYEYSLKQNSHFEFVFEGVKFRSSVYPSKLKDVFFRRLFLENGVTRAHYIAKQNCGKFGLVEMHFYLTPLLDAGEKVVFVDPKYLKEAAQKKPATIQIMGTRLCF